MSLIIPIIMGSIKDLSHAKKIHIFMKENFQNSNILLINRICSAHKYGTNLLKILKEYENKSNVICYITIAGRSNALSAFIDGHTSKLVISNPPLNNSNIHNLHSSTSMPSGVSPLVILGPENCALAAVKVASCRNPHLISLIKNYQKSNRQKLRILDIIEKYNSLPINCSTNNVENLEKEGYKFIKSGKVRNIYEAPDKNQLMISASDRLSAYDRNICTISFKGSVLNQVSLWWFEQSKHLVPNHIIKKLNSTDVLVKKCRPILIEFVVRGYMTGSSKTSIWKNYESGSRYYCGHNLPEGFSIILLHY